MFDEADSEAAERLRVVEFADAASVLQKPLSHGCRRIVADGERPVVVAEKRLVRPRRLGLRKVEQYALHDDRSGTRGGIAEKFGQKLLFGQSSASMKVMKRPRALSMPALRAAETDASSSVRVRMRPGCSAA